MANEKIDKLLNRMRTDDSVDAPMDSVKWVKNLFRTRIPAERSLIEKIRAVLQIDIGPAQPVFGERSSAAGLGRQVLFTAGETSIDIRIAAGKRDVSIRGQLVGEGLTGASVRLLSNEGNYESTADREGEFTFERVAPGVDELQIQTSTKLIVIERIELP
jgi:hypothetical protein